MTDEEIYIKYIKEHSKLIMKYELKGDVETYQKKLEKLKEKYKGTIVEKLEEEYFEEAELEEEEEEVPLSQEEIFAIKEPDEFVIQYMIFLEQKCDYGNKIEVLNSVEKVIYYVDTLNSEVHSSGFEGYLSSDNFPGEEELEECLIKIKAMKVLKLWKKVKSKFPGDSIPKDMEKRLAIIERKRKSLDKLDSQFYDYPDDLEQLLFEYAQSNLKSEDSLT